MYFYAFFFLGILSFFRSYDVFRKQGIEILTLKPYKIFSFLRYYSTCKITGKEIWRSVLLHTLREDIYLQKKFIRNFFFTQIYKNKFRTKIFRKIFHFSTKHDKNSQTHLKNFLEFQPGDLHPSPAQNVKR